MTATLDDEVADLRRANAELQQRLDEALAREAATAEVLGVINSSPGDPAPVFDAMLEKAVKLCAASFGLLMRYDGDLLNAVAHYNSPPQFVEFLRTPVRPASGMASYRILRGEDVVTFADVAADPSYSAESEAARRLVELSGARSHLTAALRRDGVLLGVIVIYRQEVLPFTEREIALVKNFAAQAVIAMENARLLTETREALAQQTATAEVLQVINSSPGDLTPVFNAMLEKAMRLCGAAFGFMTVIDGEQSRTVAARGVPAAYAAFRERNPTPANAPISSRVRKGEPFIHTVDLKAERFYGEGDPQRRAIVDLGGARTLLAVPLMRDQAVLGAIQVYRTEVRPFSDKQIALLQNFAAQAVVAMENARLITETREALEQQTATAEVLQVINSSPGDLGPVFNAMLDKATRLSDAAFGVMQVYEGERFRTVATRRMPPALDEFLFRTPRQPTPHSAVSRILDGEDFVQFEDMTTEPAYLSGDPRQQAFVKLGGTRSYVAVALRKDDRLLGTIATYRQDVRPFSDKQIALLKNFAAQAVIAMENARLITETQEALEQQTATAAVLQVINSSPGDLQPVFDAMLDKALGLCGADFGVLWTYDGERVRATALRGVPPIFAEFLMRTPHPVGPDNAHGRLLRGEPVVHIADVTEDEAYRSGDPIRRTLVELGGGRSLLAVPLRKDNTFLGDFVIYRQEVQPFSDKQIALLRNFAAQAVIAMENARLLDEIRQRQAELRVTFDNMADGVVMFDEDLRLAAWNHNFQEILGLPDVFLAEPRTYAEYIRYLGNRGEFGAGADPEAELRRYTENADRHYSFERTRPDGRVIEVRHNPVPSGGFVLIYSDITERKRSEAEIRAARDAAEEASRTIDAAYRELKAAQANLIQAEKMASLGQLTAGIAHEIKNPLNFVNNFAGLSVELLDELKETAAPALTALGDDKRTEIDETIQMLTGNLEKIAEHGRRADNIVKSMLEHSRGSSGERRSVDLNSLIDEALNLAYHGARAQDQNFNVTLERDYGAAISPIELVPQDITRVCLNLFSNGFYATTKRQKEGRDPNFRPTLKVSTRDLGDEVEIRIRDNGTGVPPEIKDKLFQPFFTTKPTGEGTGLGLSISYDIVTQQHGGAITVDSRVGEFTEFIVRLPRAHLTIMVEAAS
jgi:GAF domain-containing protein/nitrogen-specific signal transduction histidine kinase